MDHTGRITQPSNRSLYQPLSLDCSMEYSIDKNLIPEQPSSDNGGFAPQQTTLLMVRPDDYDVMMNQYGPTQRRNIPRSRPHEVIDLTSDDSETGSDLECNNEQTDTDSSSCIITGMSVATVGSGSDEDIEIVDLVDSLREDYATDSEFFMSDDSSDSAEQVDSIVTYLQNNCADSRSRLSPSYAQCLKDWYPYSHQYHQLYRPRIADTTTSMSYPQPVASAVESPSLYPSPSLYSSSHVRQQPHVTSPHHYNALTHAAPSVNAVIDHVDCTCNSSSSPVTITSTNSSGSFRNILESEARVNIGDMINRTTQPDNASHSVLSGGSNCGHAPVQKTLNTSGLSDGSDPCADIHRQVYDASAKDYLCDVSNVRSHSTPKIKRHRGYTFFLEGDKEPQYNLQLSPISKENVSPLVVGEVKHSKRHHPYQRDSHNTTRRKQHSSSAACRFS